MCSLKNLQHIFTRFRNKNSFQALNTRESAAINPTYMYNPSIFNFMQFGERLNAVKIVTWSRPHESVIVRREKTWPRLVTATRTLILIFLSRSAFCEKANCMTMVAFAYGRKITEKNLFEKQTKFSQVNKSQSVINSSRQTQRASNVSRRNYLRICTGFGGIIDLTAPD